MNVNGVSYRTIWQAADGEAVEVVDQTLLPHRFETVRLETLDEAARAISEMVVRGAPLIGATAAWGLWLAVRREPDDDAVEAAAATLVATRPTAVNLRWAVERMVGAVRAAAPRDRAGIAAREAAAICNEDVAINLAIGEHGLPLLGAVARARGRVNVLTHCNAGWLATVDWGTALAPVYRAHEEGIEVHVWVDETRPRNQGAALTAWELGAHGVAHTVVVDNAGGHLMQRGLVDLCLVGTDRTTASGDVANKIGTYLKALAAADCGVPFYVALPHPTIDWSLADGFAIPIEERDPDEVLRIRGRNERSEVRELAVAAPGSPAANPAFDITPARLVTGLLTDRGLTEASPAGLRRLFPAS